MDEISKRVSRASDSVTANASPIRAWEREGREGEREGWRERERAEDEENERERERAEDEEK